MDDESRRAGTRRLVEAISTQEMEPFDAIYHDDVVIEWPQSGEVIRGKKNIRELRLAFPTPPTATLRRVIGSGDLWAAEMVLDYDGDPFYSVLIHEYRDGLVVRETCYYGAPFEAPAWR
ncbi:MAG: nuclear transport factor 2 family protein, partial [Propionibacteriaceae bacterium]